MSFKLKLNSKMYSTLLLTSLLITFLCLAEGIELQFESFGYCLKQDKSPNLLNCFGKQALDTLQHLNEASNFTLAEGLTFIKDDDNIEGRNLPINFLDQNPDDLRYVLLSAVCFCNYLSNHIILERFLKTREL